MNDERMKRVEQIKQHINARGRFSGCCGAHHDELVAICEVLMAMLTDGERQTIAGPVASTEQVELAFWRMRMGRDPMTGEEIDQYCNVRHAADNAPCMLRSGHKYDSHMAPNGNVWF